MTEAEWLNGIEDLEPATAVELMLNLLLERGGGERKFRLLVTACCKRLDSGLLDRHCQAALNALEVYTEGRCSAADLELHSRHIQESLTAIEAQRGPQHQPDSRTRAAQAVRWATSDAASFLAPAFVLSGVGAALHAAMTTAGAVECEGSGDHVLSERVNQSEAALQVALLREIFGNPFRPVTIDPAWLTSTVAALAGGIYEDRAFDRMPILADALRDAGCDNEAILTHCRSPEPHVRGCWCVDLLLGKT